MKFTRALLFASSLAVAGTAAWAQTAEWPSRPIRIVTPTPAGVGSDAFARAYADKLTKALNVGVVVENKPGALATLGTDTVAKAAPDGYTVLFSTSNPFTTVPFLLPRIPYDPKTDFTPVMQALRGGSFIVASNTLPARSMAELVALAKSQPGKISFASYGLGTTSHLGFELIQEAAGIEMLHVPYKQGVLPDLMSGQVMLGFEPPISALPNIKAGRVRALAYTGSKRSPALPDVPTLAELYPGLEIFTWLGFWVPAKTPAAVVQRLHQELSTINRSPEMVKYITDAGLDITSTTPAEAEAIIKRDAEVMGKLIKAKGIKLE